MERLERLLLTNGHIVTPQRLIEAGTVVIEGGKILDVVEHSYPTGPQTWDVGGRLIMPGVINLHDDGYEKALQPRDGVFLPPALVFHHMEWALAASGITSIYHAVSFDRGLFLRMRTIEQAEAMAYDLLAFSQADFARLHHRILYRCDLRSANSLDTILKIIHEPRAAAPDYYLSLNDHAPGQGQYARSQSEPHLWDLKAQTEHIRAEQLGQAAQLLKRSSNIIIASHDDDSIATVDAFYELGVRVSEFPVNREAAQRAKELGLPVIVGAPNIVRGGSHNNNVSALELVADHLADVLVADYAPSTLLHAVFMLVEQNILSLIDAVRLVTTNAASIVGIEWQTVSIVPGLAADIIIVEARSNPLLNLVQLMLVDGNVYHHQIKYE
ncbi:MAG: alpha-D-ribose 1-methylphosphonate 5-triphosphate diphosphatase [Ktedonobacteraceae bacterium]